MGLRLASALSILLACAAGCTEARFARDPGYPPPVEVGLTEGADGIRLFYERVGRGEDVVVYLHGGPGSNFHGNGDLMHALARNRTLIMYNQRGSGGPQIVTDPERLEAEDHVRDLEALRQHFGIERMSLIGLSWGSGLATLYAARYPERVERMLLISPMSPTRAFAAARAAHLDALLGPAAVARRDAIRARWPQADDEEIVALCHEAIDMVFRLYLVRPAPEMLALARLRCTTHPDAIRNRPVVEAATMGSLGDWDFRPLLQRLTMPVLVMEGARTNVPLDATRAWVAALPNARLHLVEDAGHEFFLDQPRRYERAANQFLLGRFPRGEGDW
jgi:proline iminopeptidase